MADHGGSVEGMVRVGTVSELKRSKNHMISTHVRAAGADAKSKPRAVLLALVNGHVHCLDRRCFHAGGPLDMGDIEELDGRTCIRCPWHRYAIDIETGDHVAEFHPIGADSAIYKRRHRCQRKHEARVDEKGGVWVRVGGGVAPATVQRQDKFASDRYAESSSSDDGNEEEPKTITLDLSSVVGGLSSASNPAGESEN